MFYLYSHIVRLIKKNTKRQIPNVQRKKNFYNRRDIRMTMIQDVKVKKKN